MQRAVFQDVTSWEFRPATRDGSPVDVDVVYGNSFQHTDGGGEEGGTAIERPGLSGAGAFVDVRRPADKKEHPVYTDRCPESKEPRQTGCK